jgi:hypothetical protein
VGLNHDDPPPPPPLNVVLLRHGFELFLQELKRERYGLCFGVANSFPASPVKKISGFKLFVQELKIQSLD